MISKFKTIGELENAYTELEKAFTKKCKENKALRDVLDKLKVKGASETLVNAVNAVYEPLLESKIEQTRQQVCQEIRDYLNDLCDYSNRGDVIGWYLSKKKFNKILDQIEKGETK